MERAEQGEREPASAGEALADRPHAKTAGVPCEPAQAGEWDSDVSLTHNLLDLVEDHAESEPDAWDGLALGPDGEVHPTVEGVTLATPTIRHLRVAASRMRWPGGVPNPLPGDVDKLAGAIEQWFDARFPRGHVLRVLTWIECHGARLHEGRSPAPTELPDWCRRLGLPCRTNAAFATVALWSQFLARFPQYAGDVDPRLYDAFQRAIEGASRSPRPRTSRQASAVSGKWKVFGDLARVLGMTNAKSAASLKTEVTRCRREMQAAGLL